MRLLRAAAAPDVAVERGSLMGMATCAPSLVGTGSHVAGLAPRAAGPRAGRQARAAAGVLAISAMFALVAPKERLAGTASARAPITSSLAMGERAAPAAPAPTASAAEATARDTGEAPEPPAAKPQPVVRAPRRMQVVPATAVSAAPSAEAAPAQAGEGEFAAGVGSMARGNFGEAIDRLAAFRRGHPHDARAEDAAFLVIVALERAGKHGAASAAARDYLATYP
jgi:hypothetical protein